MTSASVIGGVSLLTAILNFSINVVIAKFFGSGSATDALFLALTVSTSIAPPLVSSLDSAFLPVFHRLEREQRPRLAGQSVLWFAAIFIVLGLLVWSSREIWLQVFLRNPGLYQPDVDRLILAGVVGFVALGTAMTIQKTLLTAHLRFGWIGLTTALPPGFALFFTLGLHRPFGTFSVVFGLAVGTLAALFVSYLAAGSEVKLSASFTHVRELLRMTVENAPVVLSALLFASTSFILRATASLAGPGGISTQYYAERIFLLPHALFAVSAGAVILPFLRRWQWSDRETIAKVILYACLVMGPISLVLVIFGSEIVAIVLQRGQFDVEAAAATTDAVRGYSLGLVPLFIVTLVWRVLQARRLLAQVVLVGVVFMLGAAVTAVPLQRLWGLFGIGAANTVGAISAMWIGLAFVELATPPTTAAVQWKRSVPTLSLGLVAMALTALGTSAVLHSAPATLRLGVGILASAAVYLATLYVIGSPEVRELRGVLR